MTATDTRTIPFSCLAHSVNNARRTDKAPNIESLAASILAVGLLQNLVVTDSETDDPATQLAGGLFFVEAGGRRLRALTLLVERGDLPADFPVPCTVVPEDNAAIVSLTENVQREAMHPADEFEAFQKLAKKGMTIDRIADAFGVTPLVVERRLKLAAAAPELLDIYRAGDISTDQLIALCATDDHAKQLNVWKVHGPYSWQNEPSDLRRAVLRGEVDATDDARVDFIGGLDAYRAAGGEVRSDLFTGEGNGGFLSDETLLDRLVSERLEREAEALRAEGWGWVDIWPHMDMTALNRLGRAPYAPGTFTPEEQQRLDALNAEHEALAAEAESIHEAAEAAGEDDLSPEQEKRCEDIDDRQNEIEEEIEAIQEQAQTYAPDVIAKSGALVIYSNGKLRIERGLVRTADRSAVAAAAGEGAEIEGGRESEPAGRKDGNTLSDALRRSLLGHRNIAAQIETAKRPDVAKVILACWTVQHIRERGIGGTRGFRGIGVPSDIHISDYDRGRTRVNHPVIDEAGKAKGEAFRKACAAAVASLPEDEKALWDDLSRRDSAELDALIAWGVALSVSLSTESEGLTGKLIDALELDMAEHFEPTAENYLGKVSKGLIIEAMDEAGKIVSEADRADLVAMKKGDLIDEAARSLAGTGWVPKLIRTPARTKKQAAPKPAKAAKKPAPKVAPAKPATTKAKTAAKPAPAKKSAA